MKIKFFSILIILQTVFFSFGQNLTTEIDNIALNNDMMGGAVVVFCETGITKSYYFGKSDFARNIDITENTKFRIASISKTITAVAAMQLVEQNLLDLDGDINQILGFDVVNPYFPNVCITSRMLLSHTSSIVDGSTYSEFLNATINNNPIPNLSEILTTSGNYYDESQFNNTSPGAYFEYSNINFVILGTLIEKISNLRFDVYCKQNIFEPLNIDASFNVNDLTNIDNVAVLYRKISGNWTPQAENYQGIQPEFLNLTGYIPGTNGARFGPQGGLRISAQDLAKFFMCLNNPNECNSIILTNQSITSMKSNQWTYDGSNGNNYYGLFQSWGLGIHRVTSTVGNDIVLPASSTMFGHTGEAYGLVSDAYVDTNRNMGFVFITNGVGIGYNSNSYSAFYTVEQEIFSAIENYGNIQSCSININEVTANSNGFTIFPNPGNNNIQLDINSFEGSQLLKVFGIDGRIVFEKQLDCNENSIKISNLCNGVYFFKINDKVVRFLKY